MKLRQRRSSRLRYFTNEEIRKGFGIMVEEAREFPRADRDRLAAEIERVLGMRRGLRPEVKETAMHLAGALRSPDSMLNAIRQYFDMREDTRAFWDDLRRRVNDVAQVVPAVRVLHRWIWI